VDALPKGYPQGADGAREASESSPFQSAGTFLAKIREQGIGASRAGLSLRDCLKSLASPKTKAVEAYEGGQSGIISPRYASGFYASDTTERLLR
jgi:hypothetical protein